MALELARFVSQRRDRGLTRENEGVGESETGVVALETGGGGRAV